ncbi:MAG: hypothetical protein ACK5O1_05800 [Holosporales bacterium]
MIKPSESDNKRRVVLRQDEDRGSLVFGIEPFGGNSELVMVEWDSDGKYVFAKKADLVWENEFKS